MGHDTSHQWHIQRGDEPRARIWCDSVMQEYGFRPDVRTEILDRSIFFVGDWRNDRGGGHAHIHEGRPYVVWLDTAQTEAAVHECAHVAWQIVRDTTAWAQMVELNSLSIRVFWREADRPQVEPYKIVRELCHEYKYGVDSWPGLCPDGYEHCNLDEIIAGLASGTMGDMSMMPVSFKPVFGRMFRWPRKVFLPFVSS